LKGVINYPPTYHNRLYLQEINRFSLLSQRHCFLSIFWILYILIRGSEFLCS